MKRSVCLLVIIILLSTIGRAQQPQAMFDEIGDVRLTTVLVPKTIDQWVTLISVTPTDAFGGGVDKWMWLSHPDQIATPQDLTVRARIVFNGSSVTVSAADTPPIEFMLKGTRAAHLIGAWRVRRDGESMTHDRLLNLMMGTLERNGGN